jgi:hypothetical protein
MGLGRAHGWAAEARARLGWGKEEGRASWAAWGKEGKGEREMGRLKKEKESDIVNKKCKFKCF